MKWETDKNNNKLMTCVSNSKSKELLVIDIENASHKLINEELVITNQVLFYIDGTNGYIFISGFDSNSNENFDDSGIYFEMPFLWEDYDNSILFDEFVVETIKSAFESNTIKDIYNDFEVFYQTEMSDVIKI